VLPEVSSQIPPPGASVVEFPFFLSFFPSDFAFLSFCFRSNQSRGFPSRRPNLLCRVPGSSFPRFFPPCYLASFLLHPPPRLKRFLPPSPTPPENRRFPFPFPPSPHPSTAPLTRPQRGSTASTVSEISCHRPLIYSHFLYLFPFRVRSAFK